MNTAVTGTVPSAATTASAAKADGGVFYRPELDGLRFFAFMAVFIRHTTPMHAKDYASSGLLAKIAPILATVSAAGMYGVDLFFVLSSYLITELLIREKDRTGTVNIRAFYARRILRIWPLYFFFLGVTYLFQFFVPSRPFPLSYLAAFVLMAGNWIYVFRGITESIGGQLWSVSIEEQFYLLWPNAVARLTKCGIVYVALALVGVALLSRSAFHLMGFRTYEVYWFSTVSRVDSFASGMLLAVVLHGGGLKLRAGARVALSALGLSIWLCTARFLQPGTSLFASTFGYSFVALGAALLIATAVGQKSLLSSRPAVFLGRISYGLYVYHVLAIVAMMAAFGGRPPKRPIQFLLYFGGALAITIWLSAASYRWLEVPFLKLKERFAVVRSRPVA